ncbi:MAG: DNA polymerase III subunit delta, partial [Chloroflexota bacterium]
TKKDGQEKFNNLLSKLPQTTALVLFETKSLKGTNWLMKWAKSNPENSFAKNFGLPDRSNMIKWIRNYAQQHSGEITPQGASLLAEIVGSEPRRAGLEIEKLLAYVNYSRPVDEQDVELLAAFVSGGGDFFAFIDSIARRDGRVAMNMLNRLLDEQDPLPLFFSLVSHFRLLIQTREIFEGGGQDGTVANVLSIHPFRAKKLFTQAKTLAMPTLEAIYQRLLSYDIEIKTGQILPALALETLVAMLTTPAKV